MSVGDEVIDLLVANSLGVEGSSLYKNRMPETPDVLIAVFETAGLEPQAGFGVSGIQHERPGLEIRFRGVRKDPNGPYTLAQAAYRLFMTQWGAVLSGTQYLTLKPNQAPYILDRDGNERVVWAFNVLVEKELS